MKKLIFYLLLTSSFLQAQDVLTPIVELESGYGKRKTSLYEDRREDRTPKLNKHSFYTDVVLGLKYKNFIISTDTYTYFNYASEYKFSPWLAIYEIEVSYTYKFLTVGANHQCFHKVISANELPFNFSGGYDHIYVRFKIK